MFGIIMARVYGHCAAVSIDPFPWIEAIHRTGDATGTASQHMGVDLRRFDVRVAQELLHRPDVLAALDQMRGERVPVMSSSA